jgi:hypothetical protein
MYRNLILAFLIAAPLGVAFGFAAKWLLSPYAAAGAFNGFLALIILGVLGMVLALRPARAKAEHKSSMSLAA